ncbi:thioredoxin family protein [Caldanaerobius polysaccharolyticus]|uniref:thioredoxin family protein n=1 Tax=Caldanaerobius polysaccharolyticus TaxID=44256 RepID=UPI000478E1D9|nr:thioredoxin family protein [Caldanaerobius polysaccharolyticus]
MEIKILGGGCANCKALERLTREAIHELNISADITEVKDIQEILKYGVMSTPALVVNEKVLVSGRVPSKSEILNLIKAAVQ